MTLSQSLPYSFAALRPRHYLNNVITITSETAVGSSTAIAGLKAEFGDEWQYVSGGSIMRAFAETRGESIEKFAAHNKAHPEDGYDNKCDQKIAELGRRNKTVIEGRLPHVFVPHAFHVLMICPVRVRAGRRLAQDLAKGRAVHFDEVLAEIMKRDQDDNQRYARDYPGCLWPSDQFDLVVSTFDYSKEESLREILSGHTAWQKRMGLRARSDPEFVTST